MGKDERLAEEFESMVRTEYRRVYRFAFHLTGEREAAFDLTQESFRSAWEHWASFKKQSAVSTWLHQIVYRRYVDIHRREKARQRLRHDFAQSGLCHDAVECHSTAVQIQHDVQSAVGRLAEAERVAITLRYFQGLSVAETSSVTGEPTGTVKWRTRRALTQLQEMLCEEIE